MERVKDVLAYLLMGIFCCVMWAAFAAVVWMSVVDSEIRSLVLVMATFLCLIAIGRLTDR